MNDNVIPPAAALRRLNAQFEEAAKKRGLLGDFEVTNLLRGLGMCAEMLNIELDRINKELADLRARLEP